MLHKVSHASIAKRPVFKQLMDDASRCKFDVVVVHTLDRWSRDLRVSLEAIRILDKHQVEPVSIMENLDRSTPGGRMSANIFGVMAEFYSENLATHVKKGQQQRAMEGRHTGGIPSGYDSCWKKVEGRREPVCNENHPRGVHVHETEGPAVAEMFKRYAKGTTALAQEASRLNEAGFRTWTMHRAAGGAGYVAATPRLFTTASIRVISTTPFTRAWSSITKTSTQASTTP